MSRQMFHLTMRFPQGKVLQGQGRNLPATVEKIYNEAFGKSRGRHVVLLERLVTGHVQKAELRYEGTFHGQVLQDDSEVASDQQFVVEVRRALKTG